MGDSDANTLIALFNAVQGSGSLWATALFLIGAAVVLAHRFGLLSWLAPSRTPVQSEAFQDRLLKALEASHAREDALQGRLKESADRYDVLREEHHEGRLETHMMRQQLRMLLRGLQQVRGGEISIEALPLPEVPGEAT